MSELTTVRTPAIIAGEVRHLKEQVQRIVLGHAIEIGRRLTEAKNMLDHGQWADWLKTEVSFSQSTANNMMRIFDAYGNTQMGLFGPEANSQTFGNLEYSKALLLLAVPEEERETFAESVDAEHISVRELKKAIKERDEAENRAKGWEEKYQLSQQAAETAKADAETARENLEKKEKDLALANQRLESLNIELKELRERPIDVAVQDASEEQIAEAEDRGRAQAEKELKEQLKKAERDAEQALEALEAAKRDARKGQADQTLSRINFLFQEIQRKQEEILALLDDVEQEKKERINAALEQGFRTLLVRMEVENNAYKS